MAILTKAALAAKINSLFLDNNQQLITESVLREVTIDIVDTLVNLVIDSNNIEFGDGADSANKFILFNNGDANTPGIRYNVTSSKLQFSNDGLVWQDFGTGGGISGLVQDELVFGNESGTGDIQQSAALKFINSTTKLVIGTTLSTELDGSGVLKILHDISDYIRIYGKGANEQGRLALGSNDAANPAELAAFNNGAGTDAFLRISNSLGGLNRLVLEVLQTEMSIHGRGGETINILELYNHLDNIVLEFKNRGEIIGSYTGLIPITSEVDKASFFINNSKVNGVTQDGNASWFIRTEDGKVIDLRVGDIRLITREMAYPLEDSKPFEFKGNSNVFKILGVSFDPIKIASVSYQVRRPAVGLPAGLIYQNAADLNDVIAWHGGSNLIDGNAYISPSITDHLSILPQVLFQAGWTSTASFTFIIQILSA